MTCTSSNLFQIKLHSAWVFPDVLFVLLGFVPHLGACILVVLAHSLVFYLGRLAEHRKHRSRKHSAKEPRMCRVARR